MEFHELDPPPSDRSGSLSRGGGQVHGLEKTYVSFVAAENLRQFCRAACTPGSPTEPLNAHFPIGNPPYRVLFFKNFACGALKKLFLPLLARRRRKFLGNQRFQKGNRYENERNKGAARR